MIEHINFRPLFSEITPLFLSNRDTPNIIRVRIRMQNEIDEKSLRHAVGVTMGRYPFFVWNSKNEAENGVLQTIPVRLRYHIL